MSKPTRQVDGTRKPKNQAACETVSKRDMAKRAKDSDEMQQDAAPSPESSNSKRDEFDILESHEFVPNDYESAVFADSLEASIGYSSLLRQIDDAFARRIAFYRSKAGGSLSVEEARKAASRTCSNIEEAREIFDDMKRFPVDSFDLLRLASLHDYAPRVAEHLWEKLKEEGPKEFESGHLADNTMFPVSQMKDAWNIARYLGLR
jgi:hypothetical protein